jgi:hypothetical protein
MSAEASVPEQINRILEPLGIRPAYNALSFGAVPPAIDLSKPNIHDSKPEFLAEMSTVESGIEQVEQFIRTFHAKSDDDRYQTLLALRPALDDAARRNRHVTPANTALDLVARMAVEAGVVFSALFIHFELRHVLVQRKQELEAQREEFWSAKHRPPNHYARIIALRLAIAYARVHQKKPTVGVSRDGGHPSTAFTRALEQVFAVLEISADVRNNAKWARDRVKPEHMAPTNALLELAQSTPTGNSEGTLGDFLFGPGPGSQTEKKGG